MPPRDFNPRPPRGGRHHITIQGVSDGKRLLQADTMYIRKRKTRKSQDTMLGAEHAAPVINARSELPLSLSSDTTVPQGTADVNTQGSTEYTPLRMPTLDAEGAANEVKMPVISENAPADRKAAQFDIIRQSNTFDAELGNHTWIKFQSTPPARGATRRILPNNVRYIISIHAPREGGDRSSGRTRR